MPVGTKRTTDAIERRRLHRLEPNRMSTPPSHPGDESIRPQVLLYSLRAWVAMAVLAVLNGGVRELLLIPRVGGYPGHVLSTALLVVAIVVVAFVYFDRTAILHTRSESLTIGVLWVLLTVGFEFVVGYVEGTPVAVTLAQYDVLAGQVWIVVPITLFVAPLIFGRRGD